MKKRKPLKPSFVVTIAAGTAALAAAGCLGEIITNPPPADCPESEPCDPPSVECPESPPAKGAACEPGEGSCSYKGSCDEAYVIATCGAAGWELKYGGGSCNPPFVECPETPPQKGGACASGYGSCDYYDECGYVYLTATCGAGGWEVEYLVGTCNPPPVDCPGTVPWDGDPCEGWGSCEYDVDCGQVDVATCNGGTWEVQYAPTCNPPPPCTYFSKSECESDSTCVWHTPGCGDETIPPLPQAGCFVASGCTTGADCLFGVCQQVVVSPDCVEEGCDACGMAVNLCVQ